MPGAKTVANRKKKRKNRNKHKVSKASLEKDGFLQHHTEEDEIPPKSFVIQQGMSSSAVRYLISDFKKVMKPNTAIKLKTKKKNTIQDFVGVSSGLGVTHMIIFSQKDSGVYMKIGKIPNGPTVTYKISGYSLMKDVIRSQKRPMVDMSSYMYAPCLMTNLQPTEGDPQVMLTSQMFLNMFPNINPTKQRLTHIKRACLINYDEETETYEFRHYCIRMRPVGISKGVRKLFKRKTPNLKKFTDISDMMLKSELLSESEAEDDERTTVEMSKAEVGGKINLTKAAVRLAELGPRLTLKLFRIEEGLCKGQILYQAPKETIKEESNEEDNTQEESGEDNEIVE